MAMERQGATYALSSTLILLLLYAQKSMSFPTQLPSQLCCKERTTLISSRQPKESRVVINIMKADRGDPVSLKEVYDRGKQIELTLTLSQACQEHPEGSNTG